MGRINLSLVAAALVFGQEFARVTMQLRSSGAAPRELSAPAPVVRTRHQYTYQDSLVAALWAAATGSKNWPALDGRVSGRTGDQLYQHWYQTLSPHVQGTRIVSAHGTIDCVVAAARIVLERIYGS